MALERAISVLEIATPIAEAIPILGTPVKGALEATSKILKYSGEVKSNKQKVKELAERSASWFHTIVNTLHGKQDDPAELERLRAQVDGIFRALTAIEEATARQARQPALRRIVNKSADSEELIELRERLHDAYDQFMLASQIRIEQTVATVLALADRDTLESLRPIPEARYDSLVSPSGCLKDTRTEVLETMLSWAREDPAKFSLYWLAGLAGTGKSTIAKSFCELLISRVHSDTLMTTFFVSKNSAERRNPFRVLYTFACELAYTNEVIRRHVLAAIRAHPDVKQRPMKEQVEALLAQPIAALISAAKNEKFYIVLVIDALDECMKINRIEGGSLIQDMSIALQDLPVKLVVTSRLQDSLRGMFDSLPHRVTRRLHEIESTLVQADIERVFLAGFAKIATDHRITAHPWPTQRDMILLIERTGQLFIYARTVLQYVGDYRFIPTSRLQDILLAVTTRRKSPFAQVDALYLDILLTAARDSVGNVDDHLSERLRILTGTIVLLQQSLSIAGLSCIIGCSEREVEVDVIALSAVLIVERQVKDARQATIHIFHPSFRDFLLDRCLDQRFSISYAELHLDLAVRCLRVLNTDLKEDICGIVNPCIANSDIHDPPLAARLDMCVSEGLRYAAKFWMVHITLAEMASVRLISALKLFVNQHLLHWLELLSLLSELSPAAAELPDVIAWMQSSVSIDELSGMIISLKSAHRVACAYYHVLRDHALHIYYSVFPVMSGLPEPDNLQCTENLPRLHGDKSFNWHGPQSILHSSSRSHVLAVAISPDENLIAAAMSDSSIQLWRVQRGQSFGLHSHTSAVNCLLFSSDGQELLSGSSDKSLRLWNVTQSTAEEKTSFIGHTAAVYSCAFAPAAQVISGGSDMTVRLWDCVSGQQTALFEGHINTVRLVGFIHDSSDVISCSDGEVFLWNVMTAQKTTPPSIVKAVKNLDFSNYPAALSCDSTRFTFHNVTWDTSSWVRAVTITCFANSGAGSAVTISPDNQLLANALYNGTIEICDIVSNSIIVTLLGDVGINSMTFSSNSTWLTTSWDDGSIRVWDIARLTQSKTETKLNEYIPFTLVNLSRDGLCLISCSSSCVRLHRRDRQNKAWTLECILPILTEFQTEETVIHSAQVSPDWSRLVVACKTGTGSGKSLRSWDTNCADFEWTLQLWDISAYQKIVQCRCVSAIKGKTLEFSSDGTRIIACLYNETACSWDAWNLCLESTYGLGMVPGDQDGATRDVIVNVACAQDNSRIITGHNRVCLPDGKFVSDLRLWSYTGTLLAKAEVPNWPYDSRIRFSEDNSYIIADSISDDTVEFWKLVPSGLEYLAGPSLTKVKEDSDSGSNTCQTPVPPLALSILPGLEYFGNWIQWRSSEGRKHKLCWIPHELSCNLYPDHSRNRATHNDTVALATHTAGHLIILNFAGMLAMLRRVGAIVE